MSTARAISIQMPFEKDLSANHYLGRRRDGGYYVKKHVKAWMDALGWQLKIYHIEEWRLPLDVTLNAMFNDKRVRDLSNYSTVTLNAIKEAIGVDDTYMRWHDGSMAFKKDEEPVLMIVIQEARG